MIELRPDETRGIVGISGFVPNGAMTVIRKAAGLPDTLLRGSAYTVTAGGMSLVDSEPPYGVDLTYVTSIKNMTTAERMIQQNLVLTPTFTHGVQGWLPGTGRNLSITTDPTAYSSSVGLVSNLTGAPAPGATPTLIGHVDSAPGLSTGYTLTPPTTGGTAVATGDQMLLIHQQSVGAAIPSVTAGWTLLLQRTSGPLRRYMWLRKRVAGDAGVTVSAPAGSNCMGTLLWVRNASDDVMIGAELPSTIPPGTTTLTTNRRTTLYGHLNVGVFDVSLTTAQPLPDAADVTQGTFQYSVGSATGQRSITVATTTDANGGWTGTVQTTYPDTLLGGGRVDLIFQAVGTLTSRIIAKFKTAGIPYSPEAALLTGRVKYVSTGLTTWGNVKAAGTWAQLKAANLNWLAVQGVDSTANADYTRLFMTIVDPATGADLMYPAAVLGGLSDKVNTWLDFSILISTPPGGIPATAEFRLLHGSATREYKIFWSLDAFGITPGDQRTEHDTAYWFYGDHGAESFAVDRMLPTRSWIDLTHDAKISWTGTPGNSISQYIGPSAVQAVSVTRLGLPDNVRVPAEPVLLSDPIDVNLWCWVGLLDVGDLTHPGRQVIYQVINRADPVSISQVRGWETGEIAVITHTLQERDRLLSVIASGRVLLLRNAATEYPEDNWYLAVGDITESRIIPNHRKPERRWTLSYVRVQRPAGVVGVTGETTWADVKVLGNWQNVDDARTDWLDVLVGEP